VEHAVAAERRAACPAEELCDALTGCIAPDQDRAEVADEGREQVAVLEREGRADRRGLLPEQR
jgi:hypothetical protein